MTVRPLSREDYDQWLPLWRDNCEHKVGDEVTRETWRRLIHPKEPVFGLIAENDGHIAGLLHYILHPTTGQIEPVCYMQDVYISPTHRRQGLARRLIWELQETGKAEGWARIYWLAQNSNEAAVNLYKTLGIRLDFGFYVLPIENETT